jgi:hypothetical protein
VVWKDTPWSLLARQIAARSSRVWRRRCGGRFQSLYQMALPLRVLRCCREADPRRNGRRVGGRCSGSGDVGRRRLRERGLQSRAPGPVSRVPARWIDRTPCDDDLAVFELVRLLERIRSSHSAAKASPWRFGGDRGHATRGMSELARTMNVEGEVAVVGPSLTGATVERWSTTPSTCRRKIDRERNPSSYRVRPSQQEWHPRRLKTGAADSGNGWRGKLVVAADPDGSDGRPGLGGRAGDRTCRGSGVVRSDDARVRSVTNTGTRTAGGPHMETNRRRLEPGV